MAETKKSVRIFSLVMVLLFFITSFGFSFFVIWEMHSSDSSNNAATNTASTTDAPGTALPGFTPTNSVPTLKTTDFAVGSGATATATDSVTVNYTGAVASTGIIFQSTYNSGQPATFSLSQVIKGWELGIPGMKVGGTRQLLIPAALAYGATPPSGSGIPANASLVFNVTLEKIN